MRKGVHKTGRISKRGVSSAYISGENTAPGSNGVTNAAGRVKKRYKAGIYARLSADTKKKESIDVQIGIAEKFVKEFNRKNEETIDIAGHYCDLGKTGSNFNRDGFNRLMQDIRMGDIDCVIVKDLSRFGRNYLEAGDYIEKIFPFLGVRFIAVSDGYDTGEKGNNTRQMSTAMAAEIKNLVNDMYAKDFSVKAKTGLRQRREAGSYVGGLPPYGYTAVWEGKVRKLVPDRNTAEIVEHIYKIFVEMESCTKVSDDLNRRRINPPAVYAKTKKVYCPPDMEYRGWDRGAVERIIKSGTYAGQLVQGKSTITARDEKKRIHTPKEEWIVKENAHKALISMELYHKAQEVRRKKQEESAFHKQWAEGIPIGENVFNHVLYCGVCGKKMTRYSHAKTYADGKKARQEGYYCLNGGSSRVEICPQPNHISKQELAGILMSVFHKEFSIYLDRPGHFMEVGREPMRTAAFRTEKELKEVHGRLQRIEEEEEGMYKDYREGKLSRKEYVRFKMEREDSRRKLEKLAEELEKKRKSLERVQEKYLKAVRSLLKIKHRPAMQDGLWKKMGEELTAELVDALIEKIYVYPGKRILVLFRYANEMLEGVVR